MLIPARNELSVRTLLIMATVTSTVLWGCSPVDAAHRQEVQSNACATCHQEAFDVTTFPLHKGELASSCEQCHDKQAFVPAVYFEHETLKLDGAHAALTCDSCHGDESPSYSGLDHACTDDLDGHRVCECVGCHAQTAAQVAAPIHAGRLFVGCDRCHNTQDFVGAAGFQHLVWPLEGAHSTTPCNDCHTGDAPLYNGLAHACSGEFGVDRACRCAGCHSEEPKLVPGHPTGQLVCDQCHSPTSWLPLVIAQ